MAESFAILGLAANTAQFLGLALQLISEGRKVYISVDGVRKDHNEVRIIATEVQRFVNEIEITVGPQRPLESEDEKAIRALAKACKPLAEQLLRILGDLTVSGSSRFYRKVETVRQTVRSAWKSKDIQELRRRLLDLDRQLSDRIFRVLNK